MPKRQRSIGLSPEIIEWIEKHRGHLSFSAFAELLIREGIKSISSSSEPKKAEGEEEGGVRRRIVMVR